MYVVITGTSRGIGLELANLALSKGHHVLAIARKPEESLGLLALKETYQDLEILKVDILEQDAHMKINAAVEKWPMLDVVINNAGIYLGDESIEDFEKSFLINSIKPFFITSALFPHLKKSQQPVSLQITSQMGSIMDNTSGGSYSYRASKAALNMLFKSLSIDEKWLISLLIHPGWVQTRMGGENAAITAKKSVQGIWKLLEAAGPAQSGGFFNYQGQHLAW